MHFKPLIVIIEALFIAFMPSLETFKLGFDDRVEGAGSINGAHILKTPSDFSTCILDIAGLSVGNSHCRIHLLH